MHDTNHVVIFNGGEARSDSDPPSAAYVIAADSGYDHALSRSVEVDLLIGDLDSISDAGLEHAESTGVGIDRHPVAKDETDLELALAAAFERKASSVELIGGEGGEIAHLLGVATLIASDRYADMRICWRTSTGTVYVVHGGGNLVLNAPTDTKVSLIPMCDVHGVTINGFAWELTDEHIPRGSTRGLSNSTTTSEFSVQVGTGTLLTIVEDSRT